MLFFLFITMVKTIKTLISPRTIEISSHSVKPKHTPYFINASLDTLRKYLPKSTETFEEKNSAGFAYD